MSTSTNRPAIPWVTLGRTGLRTTALALGAYGWGGQRPAQTRLEGDEAIVATLRAAFAAGIRCIDTAEAYENEDLLGRLLPEAGAPDDLLMITKFGHGKGFSADQFRQSAERSLKQLRLEKIPLMFVHDPRDENDMKTVRGPGGRLGPGRERISFQRPILGPMRCDPRASAGTRQAWPQAPLHMCREFTD